MEEDMRGSGSAGPLILFVFLIVLGLAVYVGVNAMQTKTAEWQATAAQANAAAEQSKANVIIEQARMEAEKVRQQEAGHTDRYLAALVALSQVRSDVAPLAPVLIIGLFLWSGVLLFLLRDRRSGQGG